MSSINYLAFVIFTPSVSIGLLSFFFYCPLFMLLLLSVLSLLHQKECTVVAVSADVSSNYLILTARQLIQTLPRLEKRKMKHGKNEGREEGNGREERVGEGKEKEGGGKGERKFFPRIGP